MWKTKLGFTKRNSGTKVIEAPFLFTLFGLTWEHRPGGDFNKETVKPRDGRKVQEKRRRYERTWGGNRVDGQAAWWRGASECV